ncbi:MAG: zinc ribbon domain-containing protein [Promethearchaeia archaeon]
MQESDFWSILAQIMSMIIGFFRPYIVPIGEWMIGWVEFLLNFFPDDDLTIYFTIFIFLIIIGAIINSKWPGDKPIAIYEKKGPRIDDSIELCPKCGKPTEGAKTCPYCGYTKI